jgi:hypothetical protein
VLVRVAVPTTLRNIFQVQIAVFGRSADDDTRCEGWAPVWAASASDRPVVELAVAELAAVLGGWEWVAVLVLLVVVAVLVHRLVVGARMFLDYSIEYPLWHLWYGVM